MKNLLIPLAAALCLLVMPYQAHAKPAKAKAPKASEAVKERLVLMPLRVGKENQNMAGAMETAVVQGLEQKYRVYSGDEVAIKAKEIAKSHVSKKDCDETRCFEDIAMAFNSEYIASASVTQIEGGYLLALSIRSIADNKAVFSNSVPCEGCTPFQVINKLKELSGVPAPLAVAPVAAATEAPQPKVNPNDPDAVLWAEAQKGNSVEDYQVYLDTYPKGKYLPFAKARIKKLNDAAQAAAEQQEQQAWDTAQKDSSEESYGIYLKAYPAGRFAGLAKMRMDKLKNDVAAREEADLWKKADSSNDKASVENYLNQYPTGRYISVARAKLKAIKEEEAKGPAMVRIPGKSYELGKYHVTKGEFAKFVSETGYDTGNECYVFTDKWEKKVGYNWRNPGFTQDDNHPVACVNWNDAQAYASWLSRKTGKQYRLPIESEWEYACAGGATTEYCGSNDINAVAWYKENSNNMTHPVAQKQANGYGLYDMSGNLWQWMENKYDDKNDWRALRGGSWNITPQNVRASYRNDGGPAYRILLLRVSPRQDAAVRQHYPLLL